PSLNSLHTLRDQHQLHSFPTRRSSDLWWQASTSLPPSTTESPRIGTTRVTGPQALFGAKLVIGTSTYNSTYATGVFVAACDIYRDRKSTRLNSSHEWMSYAVFCLTKQA